MRFLLDGEQREFAATLDRMLTAADTPAAIRAWASGDHAPGREVHARLAEAGVFGLAVPEEHGGVGVLPVELAVAFVELGRHAVPGPLVETAAAAVLLDGTPAAPKWLPRIAGGEALLTVSAAGPAPYALDPDVADALLVLGPERGGTELRFAPGHGELRPSLDPARRLAAPLPGGEPVTQRAPHVGRALDLAALLTAAQALGVGLSLLERTVEYVRQRRQFGVPVGSFQTVKHRLADAKIALEFARPLVLGAAVTMDGTDVAAAKAAASDAAYTTARTALQLHGAIGYTSEYDLSLWFPKARALRMAWGSPSVCRERVLEGAGRGVE